MSGLLEVRQHHDLEQLGTESGPSASSRPWSRRSSWSERTPGGCPVGPVYAHVHPHPPSYDEVPGGFVDFDSVAEGRFLNSVRDAPGGNRGKLTTWGQQKGTPGCDSPRRQLEAESAVKALAELGWAPRQRGRFVDGPRQTRQRGERAFAWILRPLVVWARG